METNQTLAPPASRLVVPTLGPSQSACPMGLQCAVAAMTLFTSARRTSDRHRGQSRCETVLDVRGELMSRARGPERTTIRWDREEQLGFYARATAWIAPRVIRLQLETGLFLVSRAPRDQPALGSLYQEVSNSVGAGFDPGKGGCRGEDLCSATVSPVRAPAYVEHVLGRRLGECRAILESPSSRARSFRAFRQHFGVSPGMVRCG
jgi:hypothetical protein